MARPKKIDIALQGGGAHGAFTWGVLDALLASDQVRFEGITAASAGAMNAAVLTYGLTADGPEKARELLHDFWYKISQTNEHLAFLSSPMFQAFNPFEGAKDWASYMAMEALSSTFSPYQFNPMNLNPLRDILEETVDFDVLRACTTSRLYISATNVRTGKVKVFNTDEITPDVIMASACLPHLYQAVEIDGEHYWDGGYSGNPPLFPLFYDHSTRDLVVVHINPIEREELPTSPGEIQNRVNEISFNQSLLKEMRAVHFVQRLIREDMLKKPYKDHYSDILFHSIRADIPLKEYSIATKYKTDWGFLQTLHKSGKATAENWLRAHWDDIGQRSTVDLEEEFLHISWSPKK